MKQGQKVALTAALVTLGLSILKAAVGYLFDSALLVADAFHSGADMVAILASAFGLWLSSKEKTARFPYGLYRAETLVTLIIGGLIAWAGIEIFRDGYHKILYTAPVKEFPLIPVGVSLLSIVTAYFVARKEKAVGLLINSRSLIANAKESFLDIITSIAVLLGIVFSYARIPFVEGAVIIIISLLVFKLGTENLWTSLLVLLDANLDPRLQKEIEEKIDQIYGVKGVGEVRIRQSGPFRMVECEIATNPSLPLYRAHQLADQVEEYVSDNYKQVESVFIHVEPAREKTVSAIIPVKSMDGLSSKVHGHFGRAPYHIIIKLHGDEARLEIEDFYYNEFLHEKKYIGIKVIKAVVRYKLDFLFTTQIGEISYYMLKDKFVDIFKVEENCTVEEVVDKYRHRRLEQITKPTHEVDQSEGARS